MSGDPVTGGVGAPRDETGLPCANCGRAVEPDSPDGWGHVAAALPGNDPAAVEFWANPCPSPAPALDAAAVTAAAEAMEDAAMRWLGRDLGTLHRDDIAREALAAGLPIIAAQAARVAELEAENESMWQRVESYADRLARVEALCEEAERRGHVVGLNPAELQMSVRQVRAALADPAESS